MDVILYNNRVPVNLGANKMGLWYLEIMGLNVF